MESDELQGRIDLSPLDPFADPTRREPFVAQVLERSALELARRRRRASESWSDGASVLAVMAGWARPALAAAALAVVVSGIALQVSRRNGDLTAEAGVLEAMALPAPVENWLAEERAPTTADLIMTLEGGTAW